MESAERASMESGKTEEWDLCDDTTELPTTKPTSAKKAKNSGTRKENHDKTWNFKRKKGINQDTSHSLDLGSSDIKIELNAASKTLEKEFKALTLDTNTRTLPKSIQIALNNRFTLEQIVQFREDAQLAFSHPLPYFFSGSFVFPAALRSVTHGRTLSQVAESMTPAVLRGFKRHAVRGMSWPAMLPSTDPEDEVHGMMVFGMLDSQRKAIHTFEGGMFDLRRVKVEVELVGGETIEHEAGVYVWNRSEDFLVPTEERTWEVGNLLESKWFSKVISGAAGEEKLLASNEAVTL